MEAGGWKSAIPTERQITDFQKDHPPKADVAQRGRTDSFTASKPAAGQSPPHAISPQNQVVATKTINAPKPPPPTEKQRSTSLFARAQAKVKATATRVRSFSVTSSRTHSTPFTSKPRLASQASGSSRPWSAAGAKLSNLRDSLLEQTGYKAKSSSTAAVKGPEAQKAPSNVSKVVVDNLNKAEVEPWGGKADPEAELAAALLEKPGTPYGPDQVMLSHQILRDFEADMNYEGLSKDGKPVFLPNVSIKQTEPGMEEERDKPETAKTRAGMVLNDLSSKMEDSSTASPEQKQTAALIAMTYMSQTFDHSPNAIAHHVMKEQGGESFGAGYKNMKKITTKVENGKLEVEITGAFKFMQQVDGDYVDHGIINYVRKVSINVETGKCTEIPTTWSKQGEARAS